MVRAAYAAGEILKSSFNHPHSETAKSHTYYDVVSKADIDSEDAILKILSTELPTANLLSEERGFIDHKSDDTIIIDPLDGSSNFLIGLPHFSVALAHLNSGKVLASVVYNPVLDEMYFAEKGKGAFLNNKRLQSQAEKTSSYVSVNFSHRALWKEKRGFFDQVYESGFSRVMNNWSPNLDFCLLARNKIDAVVSCNSLIYDFAPGFLIAKESGRFEFPQMDRIEVREDFSMSFVISDDATMSAKLFRMV